MRGVYMSASSSRLFVSADWLAEHPASDDITLIDARMLPPGETSRDIHAEYCAGYLPGAVFFDIETLSDPNTALPHMMPSAEAFAKAMGELGISDQQPLVIYDEGNLFSALRAWWMLTHFGARQVAILSGWLAEWKAQGYPIEQGDVHPTPAHFNAVLIEGAIRSL